MLCGPSLTSTTTTQSVCILTTLQSKLFWKHPIHARWWSRVDGKGVKEVKIVYRSGKTNQNADALSRCPVGQAPVTGPGQGDVQVSAVISDIPTLLDSEPVGTVAETFGAEQQKDDQLCQVIHFLNTGQLPTDETRARKIALQAPLFAIVDGTLMFIDKDQKRAVVPSHLQRRIMEESHRGHVGAHFSGQKLFRALSRHWWWEGMLSDVLHYTRNGPECAIVTGGGRTGRPSLYPIPVQRPFQIVGVDIMDTATGNGYVLVFQDQLTKWPLVFPIPDQKSERIANLIVSTILWCA